MKWYLTEVSICISLITSDVEHLFMCLLASFCLLWKNVCLGLLPTFWLGVFLFFVFLLSCMSCLYVLKINPLSFASFGNIFSYPEGCLLFLFMVYFAVQELLHLKGSIFFKSWGKLCLSVISVISAPVLLGWLDWTKAELWYSPLSHHIALLEPQLLHHPWLELWIQWRRNWKMKMGAS